MFSLSFYITAETAENSEKMIFKLFFIVAAVGGTKCFSLCSMFWNDSFSTAIQAKQICKFIKTWFELSIKFE